MNKVLIAFYVVLTFSCTSNHTAKDFIGKWEKEKNLNHKVEIEYIDEKGFQITEFHKTDNSFNMTTSPPNYKLANNKLKSGNATIYIEDGKLIFNGESYIK